MIYEVSGPEIGWKCPKNRPKVRATWCFFEKVLAVCSKSEPPIYLLSQNSAKSPIFGDSRHLVWFPHRSKVFQLQGEAVRLQAKKVLGPNMPKSLKNTTYGHAIGMKFGEKIQKKKFWYVVWACSEVPENSLFFQRHWSKFCLFFYPSNWPFIAQETALSIQENRDWS